jgi:hypothetical protein
MLRLLVMHELWIAKFNEPRQTPLIIDLASQMLRFARLAAMQELHCGDGELCE